MLLYCYANGSRKTSIDISVTARVKSSWEVDVKCWMQQANRPDCAMQRVCMRRQFVKTNRVPEGLIEWQMDNKGMPLVTGMLQYMMTLNSEGKRIGNWYTVKCKDIKLRRQMNWSAKSLVGSTRDICIFCTAVRQQDNNSTYILQNREGIYINSR